MAPKQKAKQQQEKPKKIEVDNHSSSDDDSDSSDDEMVTINPKQYANKIISMEYKLKGSSNPQYMFYRLHNGQLPSSSSGDKIDRTRGHVLFCTNPSPFLTENSISELFSKTFDTEIGHVVMSHLEPTLANQQDNKAWLEYQSPFSMYKDSPQLKSGTYHLMLNKASAVKSALDKPTIKTSHQVEPSNFGIEKYLNDYQQIQFPSGKNERQDIKAELNQYLKEFDIKEKERMRVINTLRGKVDEKGWTKVFHRGNQGPIHASELKQKKKVKKNNVKIKHQLDLPFYKFQKVEKKKKAFEDLREQFEKDRELIERMKRQKKFESIGTTQ
ncbi:predicted protein [Naegleria gruberi]|uniref:Predicted protein n=1 Tax=Naegleria gruberi TaxID=5762 RepID=D2W332_NAEGR|nr:uncharacterized protein NAEGRDRAFT_75803 [Naegleria gruberi]EFC36512.1 predicted protein [Naegleria gruberi]|eukprot:XP_002669256.1 predicted protein [Naegleria gruberi strain NEG-M]